MAFVGFVGVFFYRCGMPKIPLLALNYYFLYRKNTCILNTLRSLAKSALLHGGKLSPKSAVPWAPCVGRIYAQSARCDPASDVTVV